MYVIDKLKISKREFYNKTGISRGTLESKSGITEDTLAKFIEFMPDIDLEWLILNKGSYSDKKSKPPSEFNEKSANYKPKKIDSNMEEILKDLSSTVRRQSEKIEQLEKELAFYKRPDAKKGAAS